MTRSGRLQEMGKKKQNSRLAGEKGAVLVALIIGITVAAGLGAAVMKMTSSSAQSQVNAEDSSRALYVAEGGSRYIIRQIQDDINAGIDPYQTVARLHGQVYPLGTHEFEVDLTYADGEFHLRIKGIINQQSGAVTASQRAGFVIRSGGGCDYGQPDDGGDGDQGAGEEGGDAMSFFVCETNKSGNNPKKYCFANQNDADQIHRQNKNWKYWGVSPGTANYQGPYSGSPCYAQGIQSCTGGGAGGDSGGSGGDGERMVICHKPGTPAEKTKRIPVSSWPGHRGHGDTEGPCGSDSGKVAVCHIPPGNPANMHTIWVAQAAVQAHLAHGDTLGVCGEDDEEEDESPWVLEEWCIERQH